MHEEIDSSCTHAPIMRHKKLITTALCGVAAGLVLALRVEAQQGVPGAVS